MYRYKVKSKLVKSQQKYYASCPRVTYGWYSKNIEPLIPPSRRSYQQWQAFKHIEHFCFYSSSPDLKEVYMNGYAFPIAIFEVTFV